jgi:lysophospholipase L1-like esterase
LPNIAAKLKAGEAVNVVFLGGSITVGGASPKGYVTFVVNWLKEQYPKATINLVNSGISGTGSDFGDRRYDRDVLSKNPDLVLIEFCVNDGDSDRTESMERMVHKTWLKNPKTDLLIFYTLDKRHMDYYKDGKLPPSASAHERVAAFYGIPSLGTAFNAASKILSGEIPWETFSRDGCHPTQEGYVYFDAIFEKALPECLKASPPKAHLLDKSITPKLRVYPPPIVTAPLEFKGEFVTPKGEKAIKVYPLPIPTKNWIKEPVYSGDDGKPLWRLSWMPRSAGGKLDASVGADKKLWETNDMVWFEGDGCFTGLQGQGLFKRHADNSLIGVNSREIGIIRFIAPTTGRYTVSVKSGPWGCWMGEDKSMSFSILKFTWKGGSGESLAFHKEVKKESKGIAIDVETSLVAGEELAFVPDVNANTGDWTSFRITVGLLASE